MILNSWMISIPFNYFSNYMFLMLSNLIVKNVVF